MLKLVKKYWVASLVGIASQTLVFAFLSLLTNPIVVGMIMFISSGIYWGIKLQNYLDQLEGN